MRGFISTLVVLCLSCVGVSVYASSLEEMFKEANDKFAAGEYEAAALAYGELENLGVNSCALHYNRATAEARLGNLGMAILHYEKVLTRSPGDENAAFNLQVLRDFVARRANEQGRDADLVPAAGPWRATLDRFSPSSAAVSFLVFYLAFFACLIIRRFVKGELPRLTLAVAAGIFAVVALSLGVITLGKRHQLLDLHEAVVVKVGEKDLLGIYEGPGSEVFRFGVEEGSRVRVLDERGDFLKIRDDQGRDGWVEKGAVLEI